MNNKTNNDYEKQLVLNSLRKLKMIILHDRLLHVALVFFIILLSASVYLQFIVGSSGLDEGTVLLEQKQQTIPKNDYKIFTAAFTLDHNGFAFASSENVNIYLLQGNYTGTTNASTILGDNFEEKLKTDSWSYIFNQASTFTIIIQNTNNKDILYSITIRDWTSDQYQKIINKSIGSLVLYTAFLPLIIYVLIRIFKKYSVIPIFLTFVAFFSFIAGKANSNSGYNKTNWKERLNT